MLAGFSADLPIARPVVSPRTGRWKRTSVGPNYATWPAARSRRAAASQPASRLALGKNASAEKRSTVGLSLVSRRAAASQPASRLALRKKRLRGSKALWDFRSFHALNFHVISLSDSSKAVLKMAAASCHDTFGASVIVLLQRFLRWGAPGRPCNLVFGHSSGLLMKGIGQIIICCSHL